MTYAAPTDAPRSRLGLALNGVGAVVVGFWLVVEHTGQGRPPLVFAVALLAVVAWLARVALTEVETPTAVPDARSTRRATLRFVCALVMVVAGSLTVDATSALSITPAIVAVAAVGSDLRHRLSVAVLLAALGAALVTVTAVVQHENAAFLLAVYGGYGLGLVVGFSRRQNQQAAVRERELFARSLEIEQEQERSALLADRARVARDIHDVLAHSLGGLVIQLDAVEALLEAGRTDEAARRVTAARALAADGLGEARRAVATLRDPEAVSPSFGNGGVGLAEGDGLVEGAGPAEGAVPVGGVSELDVAGVVAAHEELGGTVESTGLADLAGLDPRQRHAVAAVLREAFSNARRHAPGETVTVAVDSPQTGRLLTTISNAHADAAVDTKPVHEPDGHGLVGMRERIAELGGGGALEAGDVGGRFVVTVDLALSAASTPKTAATPTTAAAPTTGAASSAASTPKTGAASAAGEGR